MALFPQAFIDEVRLHANIVSVVQQYVSLKQAGRVFKGLCPFHSEKTPSFQVDPDKGFFFCFGCQKGGDVFKFVELQENLGFADAVRLLAQKAGLSLPELTDDDPSARQDSARREALLKVHEVAVAYFREQLDGPAGSSTQLSRSRTTSPNGPCEWSRSTTRSAARSDPTIISTRSSPCAPTFKPPANTASTSSPHYDNSSPPAPGSHPGQHLREPTAGT